MDQVRLQAVRDAAEVWLRQSFVGDAAADDRQPVLTIPPGMPARKIHTAVAPDCAYRLVKAAIEMAQTEICLYIYNVSAEHLLDLLRAANARNVTIRLMYDVMDTRGDERQKLAALGVELREAPSTRGRRVFTVCHQKFAVIDGSSLLLGSANWAATAIPKNLVPGTFKKGNREWLVLIDEPAIASWFRTLFQADWDIPALEQPAGVGDVDTELRPDGTSVPALLANLPDEVFDIEGFELADAAKVTPLVSPNNYFELTKELIEGATTSIDIEQQYILASGPKTEGLLAALERRKDEVAIRIIVSPAFRKEGDKDNWELSVESLAAFNLQDCLRAMNLRFYTHLHNKGIIVDRRTVVVSSTNWSENSIARAREAGVVIESEVVASYYARVFDFDWNTAWNAADVPANLADMFLDAMFVPGGFEEVHPADLV